MTHCAAGDICAVAKLASAETGSGARREIVEPFWSGLIWKVRG
jgi:hypothetical protein